MSHASRLKVAVVDARASMRALVRSGPQQLGAIDIEEARGGEAPLRALGGRPAHLLVFDCTALKLGRLRLLRIARRPKPSPFTRLTGRAGRDLVQRAVQLGFDSFLVKPSTVQTLKAKLEAIFGVPT